MAKVRAGIIVYDDDKLMALLRNLEPGSPAYMFFVKDAMRKAVGKVRPIMAADAIAAGYPTAPGTRMTRGAGPSRPYKVWGRVPRAVRAGRYVAKRKDTGDTSQRVIIGARLRGTTVGAPHANITRYSKNVERFTKAGWSRGKFAAIPFVRQTVLSSQGIVYNSFRASYIKFTKNARKKSK